MTLGMGSLASVSSSAACRPAASVAPGMVLSKNSAVALPSGACFSIGTALASAPRPASFFSSAGVAEPSAARPTATGISLTDCALSGATGSTWLMCAARRRGVANTLRAEPSPARPLARSDCSSPAPKASPSFFKALGGSSSTNSSTSRFLACALMIRRLSWPVGPARRRPRRGAPSGTPAAPGCPGSWPRRCAPGCGCDRCRPRARSR